MCLVCAAHACDGRLPHRPRQTRCGRAPGSRACSWAWRGGRRRPRCTRVRTGHTCVNCTLRRGSELATRMQMTHAGLARNMCEHDTWSRVHRTRTCVSSRVTRMQKTRRSNTRVHTTCGHMRDARMHDSQICGTRSTPHPDSDTRAHDTHTHGHACLTHGTKTGSQSHACALGACEVTEPWSPVA